MRWWPGVVLLAACGPSAGGEVVVATPGAIEASAGRVRAQRNRQPIGEGDAAAQACFDKATGGEAGAPCSAAAPASCAARCREGEVDACEQLGESFAGADAACAAKVWDLACARDQLQSCLRLGALKRDDDRQAALKLWSHACEEGLPAACTALGKAQLELPDSEEDGLKALDRACDLEDGEGCTLAARALLDDRDGGPSGRERAAKLYERACKLGDGGGCIGLALAHYYARGVDRDEQKAQSLLDGVCRLDHDPHAGDACFQLGILLGIGQAMPTARTQSLFSRACTLEHFDACTYVARDLYAGADYPKAIALADKLIAREPDHWLPRYVRGMSRFDTGLFAEAAEDLSELCQFRADWPHCHLWLFAARARAGVDGKRELEAALPLIDVTAWPAPVFDLYLGKRKPRELLVAARDEDKQKQLEQECEAHYYIGQLHLIAGRKRDAIASFEKAVATGITNFVEYGGAKAELSRLRP